ncbi:hypothetical protein HBI56_044890 [Parastagonospora nodorum]|uniref:Uncharacterized protein n=1 Tax=Phaeosphaeria nodorum (strain SN15 / ATCC MYA-4574 / FGSC 10173) TaxID=321614 RepID=A0A7U2ES61_PHANO|nr:hypothetical protein HBH56_058010 [Parastagonospora nodorum]QRC91687.1 hypothetical protein JI435_401530 [Parastagonospora nodorum SN15]KAH3931143.1 hypothetical protein HBH54_101940 [Parastagonospora nodorum]KAH3943823.1 hypothetical protein HBH53_167890 [Parastagonospora nodorum]KAH3965400.1 hypothetical protein HBH51_150520 [Parastagonospora nodorum]
MQPDQLNHQYGMIKIKTNFIGQQPRHMPGSTVRKATRFSHPAIVQQLLRSKLHLYYLITVPLT